MLPLVTFSAHHFSLKDVKIFCYFIRYLITQLKKSRFSFGLGNITFLIKNDIFFFFKLVQNPYITVRSDGSLHIERVRLQDGGEYTCVASNVAGTINKTTAVDVHGKTRSL